MPALTGLRTPYVGTALALLGLASAVLTGCGSGAEVLGADPSATASTVATPSATAAAVATVSGDSEVGVDDGHDGMFPASTLLNKAKRVGATVTLATSADGSVTAGLARDGGTVRLVVTGAEGPGGSVSTVMTTDSTGTDADYEDWRVVPGLVSLNEQITDPSQLVRTPSRGFGVLVIHEEGPEQIWTVYAVVDGVLREAAAEPAETLGFYASDSGDRVTESWMGNDQSLYSRIRTKTQKKGTPMRTVRWELVPGVGDEAATMNAVELGDLCFRVSPKNTDLVVACS